MDMRRITSVGRYTQSMETKEICILVVNEDHTCCKIVAYMLEHCGYEVFNSERAIDALSVIWERREKLGVVLTNVHRTDAHKFGIIERIENECKLQVILMSPDDAKVATNGLGIGFTVYIVKSLGMNEINSLWADALASDKAKVVTTEAAGIDQQELSFENLVMGDLEHDSLVGDQAIHGDGTHERKEIRERSEETEGSKPNSTLSKKPRVIWTKEMHQKFLEAISQLGHDKAFPKKIVEIMNIPGLTRENVASHLQKYRLCLRKAREEYVNPLYGRSSINDVRSSYFSARDFPRSSQQSCWTRFQQRRDAILSPSNIHGGYNSKESQVRPPQSLPLSFQKNFPHPENQNLPFSDAAAKHNAEGNFRMCSDQTKNALPSSNVNRHFLGIRLAVDGKSLEFGHPSSSGKNGTLNKIILSPANGDSSAQFPSTSNNSIPLQLQQQQPLPTSEGARNEDIALWGDVNENFDWLPSIPNENENSGQYPLNPTSFVAQSLNTDQNDDSYLYHSAFLDDITANQPPPLVESSLPPPPPPPPAPPLPQFQGIDYFGGNDDDFLMENNPRSFSEYFADFLYNPYD